MARGFRWAVPRMISVVSPVYGCTDSLMELCRRTTQVLERTGEGFEIILVDDGDRDGAWSAIEALSAGDPRIRGIRLSRNFGQHHAISAGIEHSLAACSVRMLPAFARGDSQLVVLRQGFESFRATDRSTRPVLQRWASRSFTLPASLTGFPTTIGRQFRIFSRKVIDTPNECRIDRCFPLWSSGRAARTQRRGHAELLHGRTPPIRSRSGLP